MRILKFFPVLLFLVFAVVAQAQIPEMRLMAKNETPVQLSSLDARVRIFGHLAETIMTMSFYNPNSRVLEGELEFPMPEGAVMAGYALDVNGELIEGVAVEKQKAREVFEAEVRKGVDPGIVEKVKGNNFKTRVYPLPARGTRTVQVTYITDLAIDDAEAKYRIPLVLSQKTEKFALRVEVLSSDARPAIKIDGMPTPDFSQMTSGWFLETSVSKTDIRTELVVTVPVPETGAVFVEKSADGNYYFSVQGQVANPEKSATVPPAKKVAVLFDASGSGSKRNLAMEKKFLEALLASDRVAEKVQIEFVEFRNRPGTARKFAAGRGTAGELITHIDSVKYDGGTSFVGLDKAAERPDFYVLLSDGISTYGVGSMPEFAAPVYAVCSSDGADYAFLQNICRKSGGALLNLQNLEINRAVAAVGAEFFGITGRKPGKGISEVFPTGVVAVNPRFMLSGLLDTDESEIELQFGSNGKNQVSRKYQLNKAKAANGEFLRRFWAGRKIDELFASKDKNRGEIVSLSKKHGIVNEFTSLIVLERIDQYLEHRIVPPASKPEWRKEYFNVLEKEATELKQSHETKLATVISMWEARLQWWETDFSKNPEPLMKSKGMIEGDRSPPSPTMSADRESLGGDIGQSDNFSGAPAPMEQASMEAAAMDRSPSPEMAAPSSSAREFKKDSGSDKKERSVNPGVAIKAWEPDARYAKAIKDSRDSYAEYLKQKAEYGNAPSFYLDCADVFIALKREDTALQVLSNIAELELENPALIRVLAHRLSQLEELEVSAALFAEVLEMRKEEPQSYRDLALVLGRKGDYQKAVELLYEVVLKNWNGRFPDIEVIALEEMNNLIVKGKKAGVTEFKVDERLIKPVDVDLRIVMTWDADATDMDLWVYEPNGNAASYQNPRTSMGGLVSRDFTQGYGPEEYMIRKAKTGMYEIKTKFYGSSSQKVLGAVTLQIDIFTNYGREDEKRRSVTLRLTERKETFKVADVEF